ncbi:MAG TPA: protease complex subunit PrcB family protein [Polyangia bacterium]|nr:protease complex subunit PrcB family protein [Polyangia bacterium]
MKPLKIAISFVFLIPLALALAFNYCGGTEEDVVPSAVTRRLGASATARPEAGSDIAFTVFEDDIGKRGLQETRMLFVSARSYRAYFGHDAPGVDFARQWVIFYSAGTRPSDGYQARVDAMRYLKSQPTLEVTTVLKSPGAGCSVSRGQSRPAVLVRFDVPAPRPRTVVYLQEDALHTCCSPQECPAGSAWSITSCKCEPAQALCQSDTDCRMESDYCAGCDCRAMAPGQTLAACPGPGVNCLMNPCQGRQAMCRAGQCQMMPAGHCQSDADCRMESDYCTGCDCRAMAQGEAMPACAGPGVRCIANPCQGRQVACRAGQCQMMPPARCQSDADCHMERDYCAGCDCRAMAEGETLPACTGPATQCLMDPCLNQRAVCREGQCAMAGMEAQ